MGVVILILLIVVPIAELWTIVQVADGIGIIPTLLLLFGISIAGAWLLKQQGMTTWNRLREATARGEIPTKEVTDGAMILFGGALLLTPGFLTDVVGLLLLLPPSRAAVKRLFRRVWERRSEARRRRQGVYSAKVVKVERTARADASTEASSTQSSPDRPLPSAEPPDGEDGSPDTR
jgi:UPF0716 protein FxsA